MMLCGAKIVKTNEINTNVRYFFGRPTVTKIIAVWENERTVTMAETRAVNLRKEKYDVYIGRGSKWGNPFKMLDHTQDERDRVCDEYEDYFWKSELPNHLDELQGKVLGCYCKPLRCHGDFLVQEANKLMQEGRHNA
jgi:hypothetical protein